MEIQTWAGCLAAHALQELAPLAPHSDRKQDLGIGRLFALEFGETRSEARVFSREIVVECSQFLAARLRDRHQWSSARALRAVGDAAEGSPRAARAASRARVKAASARGCSR